MTRSVTINTAGKPAAVLTASGFVPTIPALYVRFDPDLVLFRYGLSKTAYAPCPAYSADIVRADGSTKHYDLVQQTDNTATPPALCAAQYYYSQWIDWPVFPVGSNTPAAILSKFNLPPLGPIGGRIAQSGPNVWKGPNDNAGIDMHEPDTGERPDLGLWAEAFAKGMLTGDFSDCLNWAMGGMGQPEFVMDEATLKPIDKIARPWSTVTGVSGTPDLLTGPGANDTPWQYTEDHNPECFAGAYFATENPIFAEACQYQAVRVMLGSTFYMNVIPLTYSIPYWEEVRDLAWGTRSLVMAAKVTELVEADCAAKGIPVPAYLLPASTMKAMLDNVFKFLNDFWGTLPSWNTLGVVANFFPDTGFIDYHQQAVLLAARWWPKDYGPFAIGYAKNIIARTDVASGGFPACPTFYRIQLGPNFKDGDGSATPVPPIKLTAADFWDWSTAIKNNIQLAASGPGGYYNLAQADAQKLLKDPYNGMKYAVWDSYAAQEAHAVLADMVDMDRKGIVNFSATIPQLENCYSVQDQMLANWLAANPNNIVPARISYTVTPSAPPVTTLPPQPTPPPTGGTTVILIQGSKHTLSLANLKDASGTPHSLPSGMVPKFSISAGVTGVTLGAQAADGSQELDTAADAPAGQAGQITGTLAYPNGDQVTLTPAAFTTAAAEDKTGDIVIT